MTGRRHPILAVAALIGITSACTAPSTEPTESDPCRRRVAAAADAIAIDEQVDLLDEAIGICANLDEFAGALDAHPGIIGIEPAVFAARRCARSELVGITTAPICDDDAVVMMTSATGPNLSPSESPVDETGYVGLDLDGELVTILPDADTVFEGDRPQAIVRMVDRAFSDGCAGLDDEYAYWYALIDEPGIGPEASVYARNAADLRTFIGCESG